MYARHAECPIAERQLVRRRCRNVEWASRRSQRPPRLPMNRQLAQEHANVGTAHFRHRQNLDGDCCNSLLNHSPPRTAARHRPGAGTVSS